MAQKPTRDRAKIPSDQSRILVEIDRMSGHLVGLGAGAEEVAQPPNRTDQSPMPTELPSQMADMHIHGAVERRSPALVEGHRQLVAGDDAAGGPDQELQHIVPRR